MAGNVHAPPCGKGGWIYQRRHKRHDGVTYFRNRRSLSHVLRSMNRIPRPRISLPATECGLSAKHAPCFSINWTASWGNKKRWVIIIHVNSQTTCIMTTNDDKNIAALLERNDRTVFFDPGLNQSWRAVNAKSIGSHRYEVHSTH